MTDQWSALRELLPTLDESPRLAGMAAGLTTGEALTWEIVRVAASSYLRLTEDEPHHPMEREEICHAFHVIQGWLGARPFVRAMNAATDRADTSASAVHSGSRAASGGAS